MADILQAGEAVVGQLHHKGHSLAPEEGPLERKRREDAYDNAEEVQPHHDQRRVVREEGNGKQAIDGELGRAAHERGEQDGHLAVALRGQGAAGHDARNRAAKANEHRHDAAARKADAPEQFIHYEGHAGHVAGIFQQRKEEEEGHDDG